MLRWCNTCRDNKKSWVGASAEWGEDHFSYSEEGRCSTCNRWSLVPNEAKNLNSWCESDGEFTDDEKKALTKFGIDSSKGNKERYTSNDLKKLCYLDEILERKKNKNSGKLSSYYQ